MSFRVFYRNAYCCLSGRRPKPLLSSRPFALPLQYYSTSCKSSKSSTEPSSSPNKKGESQQKALRVTVVSRYMQYVKSYTEILDKKFPSAMHVYRIFMVGIKEFYRDMMQYFVMLRDVTWDPSAVKQMSRKDLELYQSMPKDMIRIAPFLLISALPFANYVVFPLAYKFPRQLLCRHFWTLQQRVEFAVFYQRKRLLNQRAVFRGLQLQLESKAINQDKEIYQVWSHVIAQLGSGQHPSPDVVIQCLPLFQGDPYHLNYITPTHVNALLRLHGMHTLWRRRHRLSDYALLLHEIDLAIEREGGVETLTQDDMRSACFLRGLNPVNVSSEELCDWLSQWLQISTHVDESSLSLLLHCPILLAYNKPSNWVLFHHSK